MSAYPGLDQRLREALASSTLKISQAQKNLDQAIYNTLLDLRKRLDDHVTAAGTSGSPDYDVPDFVPRPTSLDELGDQVKAITDAIDPKGT